MPNHGAGGGREWSTRPVVFGQVNRDGKAYSLRVGDDCLVDPDDFSLKD